MEYESNSFKSKEQKKEPKPEKFEKVISGTAKTKPKSGLTKIADVFISEDVASVKSYILTEVLVPSIKKALCDIITDGAHMIFYGETGPRKSNGTASKVSYQSYYNKATNRDRYSTGGRPNNSYNCDDVIIESRGEAEEVLTRLDELVETYGIVTVADFYDLCGITCDYTANKYGWTNVRNARIVRVSEGYMIKMPKSMPIDSIN